MAAKEWGGKRESNPQPLEPQSSALPVELFPPQEVHYISVPDVNGATHEGLQEGQRTRARRSTLVNLSAADAYILVAQGAQTGRVEQVFCVDNERVLEQMLDAIKIESAELRPASAHNQGVGSLGDRVG